MKINGSTDRVNNSLNSPKYYKETPTPARETNQNKPGSTQGAKGGSKNGINGLGKLGKG